MKDDPVARLWAVEKLPGWDGLYRVGGRSVEIWLDPEAENGLKLGAEFDVTARLAENPQWLSTVLGESETELDEGFLVYGECAHGSEGYFARLDQERKLIWVAHMEESNPFVSAATSGTTVILKNNLDVRITIDLDSPEFGP